MGFVMFFGILGVFAVITVAIILLMAFCLRVVRYWQSDNVMVHWLQERIELLADWFEDLEATCNMMRGDIDSDMVQCETCNNWMSASANQATWPECWNCFREHCPM